jgi:hypothetical protein
MKKQSVLLIILTVTLEILPVSAGCTAPNSPQISTSTTPQIKSETSGSTVQVTDMANRTVIVKDNPQRIIGIGEIRAANEKMFRQLYPVLCQEPLPDRLYHNRLRPELPVHYPAGQPKQPEHDNI